LITALHFFIPEFSSLPFMWISGDQIDPVEWSGRSQVRSGFALYQLIFLNTHTQQSHSLQQESGVSVSD
jgi:hypothetical protein